MHLLTDQTRQRDGGNDEKKIRESTKEGRMRKDFVFRLTDNKEERKVCMTYVAHDGSFL